MKKQFVLILLAVTFGIGPLLGNFASVYAQESDASEFTLEEITVTAEKRSVNLQTVAVSVVALNASDLAEMGKSTTAQVLESVPNLTFRSGSDTNPNGNITIRGVQRTQESGGTNAILPSVTATYTDGVYQGIGGNYDVNRVEILRGPQGTLYGRSATGGVVSFYTNDPKLNEYSGSISGEVGSGSLENIQATVNVPIGEKVAVRGAAHYTSRYGYFNELGGKTKTKEGRLKVLFQPTDALGIVLSLSAQESQSNGGGWQAQLTGPTTIKYEGTYSDPTEGAPSKYRQAALNVNYDLGTSTLTYIAGYHDFDSTGLGAESGHGYNLHRDLTDWPTDWYHSEEIRWATDSDFQVKWLSMLVGANYFKHNFNTSLESFQTAWGGKNEGGVQAAIDPDLPAGDARGYMAPIYIQIANGYISNYGLFTEETFKVQDDFRITAGLRYDNTKINQSMFFNQNGNLDACLNSLLPVNWVTATQDDNETYNNVTYKLRFEYDLTPTSMLYALTATGFMPGYATISPVTSYNPATGLSDVTFHPLNLDQQKLTSYEIGTKNQFLNNTLRINADVFYYNYEGYVESVNTAVAGPPVFTPMSVPLKMYGIEIDGQYLITMNDKLSFDAGYESTKIDDLPIFTDSFTNTSYDSKNYIALTQLPGNSQFKASLGYDHTFIFEDGSSLVPRGELRYTDGYYLNQMTPTQVAAGLKPYDYQDAYMLANIGLVWNSADAKHSVSAYVRNVFDTEYKTGVAIDSTPPTVTPGDPRTFGLTFNVKF
jgi:outer membrane receptor protein involved in Fe transport